MITYPLYKADPAFRHAFKIFQDVCEGFGHEGLARFTSWIGSAAHNQFSEAGNRLALHEAETFKANFSIESLAKTLDTFAHIDLASELRKITVPTLLLMGESGLLGCDMPSVAELADGFKALCPHCTVVTIPDAGGTYYMFEKPKESAEEIKKFISSLSA
jgi:pimeloyl-ACP methyl ester carboxylesterase